MNEEVEVKPKRRSSLPSIKQDYANHDIPPFSQKPAALVPSPSALSDDAGSSQSFSLALPDESLAKITSKTGRKG